jgi:hypothetical protein
MINNKTTPSALFLLGLSLFILLGYNILQAQSWALPTAVPPSQNTPAPVNVSGATQVKAGALGANILVANQQVWSDEYCDGSGNNCSSGVGSGVTGSGWESVSLIDTTDFDNQCIYRFKLVTDISYASILPDSPSDRYYYSTAVSPKIIIYTTVGPSVVTFISSNTKGLLGIYSYPDIDSRDLIALEKNCSMGGFPTTSFSHGPGFVQNQHGNYTGTIDIGRHTFCALSQVYQLDASYRTYARVYTTTDYGDGTYQWSLVSDGTYAQANCF